MCFLQKFRPIFKFLTVFGIFAFTIDRQTNKTKLSRLTLFYSLIISALYVIGFTHATYKIFFDDKSIAQLFPNLFGISILVGVILSNVLCCLLIIDHIQRRLIHIKFLNLLNAVDSKMIKIWNEESYVKCYLRQTIAVYLIQLIISIKSSLALEFGVSNRLIKILFCAYHFWGVMTIYVIMLYLRYICLVLISIQRKLIENFRRELIAGPTVKWKWMQVLNVWGDFNDLKTEFSKTFNVTLRMVLTFCYQYILLAFYLSVYHFRRGDILATLYYVLNDVVVAGLVCVYMVDGMANLAKQVI